MPTKTKKRITEFGDYQTPEPLADRVCALLAGRGVQPASILEPTCGTGAFLRAASRAFPSARRLLGFDINPWYVAKAKSLFRSLGPSDADAQVRQADFFQVDWDRVIAALPKPLMILGNPPWVTNAQLSSLGSTNLPPKANSHGHRGIDALTGQSNFDISEWMLLRALEWIDGQKATLAVLCKATVARRVLRHAWRNRQRHLDAEFYRIDAGKHFGASVDAGLLVVSGSPQRGDMECAVYKTLEAASCWSRFGLRDGELVADLAQYDRWQHLIGPQLYRWRSGVKHDCSKVMELHRKRPGSYINGLDEEIKLERRYLFPMLKSSELANGNVVAPKRWMLVTQSLIGEDTAAIEYEAPHTWKYLCEHADRLDRRNSTVYRNRPRFAVFGVGSYTFAPWRVAISAFYKTIRFRVVGSFENKPIVFDDTCYFVPCDSKDEAILVRDLLQSDPAQELLDALVFPDAKRPVTVGVLGRLDLLAVAREVGADERLLELVHICNQNECQLRLRM